MAAIHRPSVYMTKGFVENVIVAGVAVVLASGALVALMTFGMFAAVVWFH